MSFEHDFNRTALRAYKITKKDFRKRYLVSEGALFQLYKEIMQVRNKEQREAFYDDFRELLKDAQEVSLTVKPKENERPK